MQLFIQQSSNPAYRYTYFEHNGLRYFADMTDLNAFVRILVPLPRLRPIEVKIKQCDEKWIVIEENVLCIFRGIFFTDDYLTSCVETFIQQQQQ